MNAIARFKQLAFQFVKAFTKLDRVAVARLYLRGQGLEIGALHNPLPLPRKARVQYMDRFPESELRIQYPELARKKLVPVNIVDDGERMSQVADQSQDFVVACHFLEHCQDPILALENMMRVLRPSGVLFLVIPDMRHTNDARRQETTWEHLTADHAQGPERSRRDHYEECYRASYQAEEAEIQKRVARSMARNYSIHFHCWTQSGMLDMLLKMQRRLGFEIELAFQNSGEGVFILRKPPTASTLPAAPQTAKPIGAKVVAN